MKFKPYEKYKKVALPWIDEVPSHWEINKVKYKFDLVKEPSIDKQPTVLSLTQRGIKIRDIESNEGQLAKSYEGYNTVKKGYICLNPMDLESGAASKSNYNGVISNAYFTIRPKGLDINSDFYSKYFNLHYKKKIFYGFGKGVGRPEGSGGRWTLNRETFINFPILFPSKEEQDKIADFLDHNLAKIDKFVELTERQIELLKEQKEVIINDAVTKGIDKDVDYKDSGIDWIGEIPEHWEVTRLKYIAKINPSIQADIENMDFNNQLVFLAMEDISETGELNQSNFKKLKEVKTGYTAFKREDVIVAKITPCFENGKGSYLKKLKTDVGYGTTELVVLRKTDKIYGEYLYKVTKSHLFRKKGEMMMKGSAGQKRITSEFLNSFKLGLPPKKEQEEIVNYIEKETNKIDRTIELYKNQIELIKEYRTSLIASAVTGKIDVRDF